jgi:hypothetical protein
MRTHPPKEEFMVEENVNYKISTSEGAVSADANTVPISILPPSPEEAEHPDTLQQAALTFNPSPPLKEAEEYSIKAPDNQAELMHWQFPQGPPRIQEAQATCLPW